MSKQYEFMGCELISLTWSASWRRTLTIHAVNTRHSAIAEYLPFCRALSALRAWSAHCGSRWVCYARWVVTLREPWSALSRVEARVARCWVCPEGRDQKNAGFARWGSSSGFIGCELISLTWSASWRRTLTIHEVNTHHHAWRDTRHSARAEYSTEAVGCQLINCACNSGLNSKNSTQRFIQNQDYGEKRVLHLFVWKAGGVANGTKP